MFNEMIVVAVTPFSGSDSTDKNGEMPVMLQCIAGRMPNRNVLSGTVARRAGFEVGKTYLVNVRQQGTDKEYGEDYTFIKIAWLESGLDIARTAKELGEAVVFDVKRPDEFYDKYERKTTAVEGLRTKRIKEGLYIPSNQTSSLDHKTADEIKDGSSAKSNEDLGLNDKVESHQSQKHS